MPFLEIALYIISSNSLLNFRSFFFSHPFCSHHIVTIQRITIARTHCPPAPTHALVEETQTQQGAVPLFGWRILGGNHCTAHTE